MLPMNIQSIIELISVMSRKFCFWNILILALNSEKHIEIDTIDRFQLVLKNNDEDIGNGKVSVFK